ncbi:MAG: Acetyltransferase family [Candidatus Woesearchaeota archaeon]|nr:Acetyltransferase family [Candidatus Woesearchaeota archaeon]
MIRKLKLSEIPFIAENYEKVMKKQFEKIWEDPITKKRYEEILEKNFEDSLMFVLEEEGIKAFIWFVREEDEINLEEVFSIKKGKGYGKKMMTFLIDYAKKEKIKRINADVHFKNREALGFFKSLGFSERTIELSLDI